MNRTDLRFADHRSSSRFSIRCRVWMSSAENGSSISRIGGSRISTWASAHTLAHPARHLVRVAVGEGGQAHPRQPRARPLARLRPPHAADLEPDRDVPERRLPGHERVRLEEVAGAAVDAGEMLAEDPDFAGAGGEEPGRDVQQRRLARPGRADDRDELAGCEGEGGVADRGVGRAAVAKGDGHVVQGDRRVGAGHVGGIARTSTPRALASTAERRSAVASETPSVSAYDRPRPEPQCRPSSAPGLAPKLSLPYGCNQCGRPKT